VITNNLGVANLSVISPKAGIVSVIATVNADTISGSPAKARFIDNPVDHDKSKLTVVKDNAQPDGADPVRLVANIVDENGNPVDSRDVVFTVTDVDGNVSNHTVTTDNLGNATLDVVSNKPGTISVTATVDGKPISGSPATATFVDDEEEDTYTIELQKTLNQSSVYAGEIAEFEITLKNQGPSAMPSGVSIHLLERPSAGLSIQEYRIVGGNATISGNGNNALITTTGVIPVDGTIVVAVSASVDPRQTGSISNGVTVWGPGKNPDVDTPDDEFDTQPIPVQMPYALRLNKVAEQVNVTGGQMATFKVTITNDGPRALPEGSRVLLTEKPGVDLNVVGYEVISGSAQVQGSGTEVTILMNGSLNPGSSIELRVRTQVSSSAKGSISNGVSVWGPNKDRTDEPDANAESSPIPVNEALIIPNLFTPNGDGVNDRFVIPNIMRYQQRELIILNRWGNQVYRSENYNNDWDGGTLGEGTYYYILKVRDVNSESWRVSKGAVAILRNTNQ
jgi:gliding motility-associated-like protein